MNSNNEAVVLSIPTPTPKRTQTEQAQREQFLAAAESARNWVTMLTYCGRQDNWSEVEFLLGMSDRVCEMMRSALVHIHNANGN